MEDYIRGRDEAREMAALRLLQAATAAAAAEAACVCVSVCAYELCGSSRLAVCKSFPPLFSWLFFICFLIML